MLSPARRRLRWTLRALFLLVSALQISQIIPELRLGWPVSPYDLFAFNLTKEPSYMEIEIVDSSGNKNYALPGNLLPIEFMNANAIFYEVLTDPLRRESADRLVEYALKNLKEPKWIGGHGIYPPLFLNPNREPRSFKLNQCRYNLRDPNRRQKLVCQSLYSYQAIKR
jgi:hypothetical protein